MRGGSVLDPQQGLSELRLQYDDNIIMKNVSVGRRCQARKLTSSLRPISMGGHL